MNRFEVALAVLAHEDPEGLLGMGAPDDEYDSEAKMICDEIGTREFRSNKGRITRLEAKEVVQAIWQKSFGLSDAQMKLRDESLTLIANRVLGYE